MSGRVFLLGDGISTDAIMPGMHGRAMIARARGIRRGLRFLVVSGFDDSAVLRVGRGAADEWFLAKPFTATELLRKVREVRE